MLLVERLKRMTLTCSSADMPGMENEDKLGHGVFAPFPRGQGGKPHRNFTRLSRNALLMTDTELKLIATPATMGLSSRPKKG